MSSTPGHGNRIAPGGRTTAIALLLASSALALPGYAHKRLTGTDCPLKTIPVAVAAVENLETAGTPFPPAFMQCLILQGRAVGAAPTWAFVSPVKVGTP